MGRGGARARARDRPAAARLDRLLGLPLVPRDGARVLRGPADRRADERALRVREGRPRGAPGRRRDLHGRAAGDDRPRRLAAERLPAPRRRAVLRRHLLPAAAAPGHAELDRRCSRASRTRGASSARTSRPSSQTILPRLAGAAALEPPGGEATARLARRRRRRRCGAPTTASTAAGAAQPKFPQASDDRVPAAARRARDGAAHAAPHGLRRHVRPGRRRLRPLQRRRPLDRPALREDALRQRAARPRVPARVAAHRRAAVRAHRHRDAGLGAARAAPGGGRVRVGARRRLRGRRGQVLRLDARARCATRSPRTSHRPRCSTSGSCPAATSRARASPCARRPTPSGSARSRPACSPRASGGCARGSTTSA